MASITMPPPDPEVVERKRKLTFAKAKYFLWFVATGCVLLVMGLFPKRGHQKRLGIR